MDISGIKNDVGVFSSSFDLTGTSNFTFHLNDSVLFIQSGSADESLILSGGSVFIQERSSPPFVISGSNFGSLYASSSNGHLYYKDSANFARDLVSPSSNPSYMYGVSSDSLFSPDTQDSSTKINTYFTLFPLRRLKYPLTASKSRIYINNPLPIDTLVLTAAFYTFDISDYTFNVVGDSLHYIHVSSTSSLYWLYQDVDFSLSENVDYFLGWGGNVFSGAINHQQYFKNTPDKIWASSSYFESHSLSDMSGFYPEASILRVVSLDILSSGGYVLLGP